MWRDIITYIEVNDLQILKRNMPEIKKNLITLNKTRNKVAHGESISKSDFMTVKSICMDYKLLEYICWEKGGLEPKFRAIEDFNSNHIKQTEHMGIQFEKKPEINTIKEITEIENNLTLKQIFNIAQESYENNDYQISFRYFKKAAKKGHIEASWRLGLMYGKGIGVSSDFQSAAYWFKKGAAYNDSNSQYLLSLCFKNGQGVKKDILKGFKWANKAASNKIPNISAQYELANYYHQGIGTNKNVKLAAFWWEKAAERGHMLSQYNIGVCYQEGKGVPIDIDKAYKWFSSASTQGYKKAQEQIDYISEWLR
jgi:Sel1 repeat